MDPIKILSRKFPLPFRGPNSSADLKAFVDTSTKDLSNLAMYIMELTNKVDYSNTILQNNEEYIRDLTVHAESLDDQKKSFLISAGYPATGEFDYFINLYNSKYVSFLGPEQHHGFYHQSIGECYPPRDSLANFFYIRDALQDYRTISREPVVQFNTEPVVTPGTVFLKEHDINNMFNGDNYLYWVREYSYPIHSDVSSVNLNFTIQIPTGLGVDPNFLVLDPFPGLGITINSVTTNTGTIIGTPIINPNKLAFEMPAGSTEITVDITQTAFKVHNGRKLFSLGFREIDAQFVSWDTTPTDLTPDPDDDSHVVLTVPLLSNTFTTLEALKCNADVHTIQVYGYLSNAEDSNVYTVNRTSINNNQLVTPSFTFAGNIDTVKFLVFLNADPANNSARNNHKVDVIHSISFRMS